MAGDYSNEQPALTGDNIEENVAVSSAAIPTDNLPPVPESPKGMRKRKGSEGKEKTETSKKKRKPWSPKLMAASKAQGICTLIGNLSEAQRNDVKSIGFDGLFEMNFGEQCSEMYNWLVERFDGRSRIFCIDKYNKFAVKAEDICDIFLLPINDRDDVVEYKNKEEICKDIRKIWKDEYGIDVKMRLGVATLKDKLLQLQEGGDDFKRMFVLYTLSTFFAPVSNRTIDFKPLKSLIDVSNISQLYWCQFVLNKLCDATEHYKDPKNSKGQLVPEKKRWFNGCIMVLQIIYLHRLKWQGKGAPCSLPLIKHWNTDTLRNRVLEEKKCKVGFGSGVCDTKTYPISGKSKEKRPASIDQEEISYQTESPLRYIKLKLNKDELDDDQIQDNKKDVTHESSMKLNRNITVLSRLLLEALWEAKNNREANKSEIVLSQNADPDFDENFFPNYEVYGRISDMLAICNEMNGTHQRDGNDGDDEDNVTDNQVLEKDLQLSVNSCLKKDSEVNCNAPDICLSRDASEAEEQYEKHDPAESMQYVNGLELLAVCLAQMQDL